MKKKLIFWKKNAKIKSSYQNILLKQLFHIPTCKALNTGNLRKSTKTVNENSYKNLKRPAEALSLKGRSKNFIPTTYSFYVLSRDESSTDKMKKDTSEGNVCERSNEIDKNYSTHHTNSYKKSKEIPSKNKLSVIAILGDSIVKDIWRQKLIGGETFQWSKNKGHEVLYHSHRRTKSWKNYRSFTLKLTIWRVIDLEIAPDMINIRTSCKTQTNKVILYSIFSRYDKLNKCLKEECKVKNIFFIDHRNISSKHNCKRRGLNSNYIGTKKFM